MPSTLPTTAVNMNSEEGRRSLRRRESSESLGRSGSRGIPSRRIWKRGRRKGEREREREGGTCGGGKGVVGSRGGGQRKVK